MTTTDDSSAKIRECAEHLAREYHEALELKRSAVKMERYAWDEIPESEKVLMADAFEAQLRKDNIRCTLVAHTVGVDFREPQAEGSQS